MTKGSWSQCLYSVCMYGAPKALKWTVTPFAVRTGLETRLHHRPQMFLAPPPFTWAGIF